MLVSGEEALVLTCMVSKIKVSCDLCGKTAGGCWFT